MRDLRLSTALAGIVCGLAGTHMSKAAEIQQTVIVPGANCQLSIPTTNTGVRPKAPGFRNESTSTSNFVICTLEAPTTRSSDFDPFWFGQIIVRSLDGLAHSVSCTGVTGQGISPLFPLKYSTKTIAIPADASMAGSEIWQSADFGQSTGNLIDGSAWFTITCNLPPQTEINYLQESYNIEIGS
jgi:hypothetical protein